MLLETDDCIIWPYARDAHGYGILRLDGEVATAHRHACRRTHGDPPDPRMDAAHGPCHEPACFNGRHLSWKTRSANLLDKRRDGTNYVGSGHHAAKLVEDDIVPIRAMAAGGMSHREIAERFGVSRGLISQVVRGELWAHVEDGLTPPP